MMLSPVPVAAIDFLQIAIFLFIIISSLVGQLIKASQDKQRQARRPTVPPPARPAEPGPARPLRPEPIPPDRPRPATSLEEEIEVFLRRAIGAEPAQPKPTRPGSPPPAVMPQRPKTQRSQTQPAKTQRPQPARLAPVVEAEVVGGRGREDVASHVERRMHHGGLDDRNAALGETVGQADERLEQRLQQVFEHRIGQLQSTTPTVATISQGTDAVEWNVPEPATSPTLAAQISQLLRSPGGMIQAIVLSEVVRRPEQRWS